jgi:signal transduction histidine kinase
LNQLVFEVVALFQESRFLPPGVQIVQQAQPQPCKVAASPDMLRQILVNLIKNAVEALPHGGGISVVSRGAAQVDALRYCTLVVQDDGPGMSPALVETLFQPRKSDKPGDNRGLGLSIVQGLVQKLGGHIRCSSSAAGTRFEVLVPAATISGASNV